VERAHQGGSESTDRRALGRRRTRTGTRKRAAAHGRACAGACVCSQRGGRAAPSVQKEPAGPGCAAARAGLQPAGARQGQPCGEHPRGGARSAPLRTGRMEEDGWKLPMEELPPGGGAHHRGGGYCPDEDLRTLDGFMPGPGMPMEQMMHHRMGEFGALRRGNRGSQYMPGGGPEGPPYRGHAAPGNGAPFPGGGDKDEMGRPMRSMHDGMAHGEYAFVQRASTAAPCTSPRLTPPLPAGLSMQAPNLANSLHNTMLGDYLTVSAPPPAPGPAAHARRAPQPSPRVSRIASLLACASAHECPAAANGGATAGGGQGRVCLASPGAGQGGMQLPPHRRPEPGFVHQRCARAKSSRCALARARISTCGLGACAGCPESFPLPPLNVFVRMPAARVRV